jgi:hypothetical protein
LRHSKIGSPRPKGVKNGPDAIEMGCLRYPRKQTSASAAAMTVPIPTPLPIAMSSSAAGGAKLTAKHLASRMIHCSDDEIIGWLERRRRAVAANRKGTFNADPLGIDLRLFGL